MVDTSKFSNKRILVVGDLMLDEYIVGEKYKISDEAPVPILKVDEFKVRLGAANVANNLKHLGCEPILCGVIGDPVAGRSARRFMRILEKENISSNFITKGNILTTTKSRVLINDHQIVRFDYEDEDIPQEDKNKLKDKINKLNFDEIDLIIVSDYKKGVIDEDVMCLLREKSESKHIIVDPKPPNKEIYRKSFCMTPNLREFNLLTDSNFNKNDDMSLIYAEALLLIKELDLTYIVITMGDKGAMICDADRYVIMDAFKKYIINIIGAGDTFISTLSMCLACGYDIHDSVIISNVASSIVVSKEYTGVCSIKDIYDFYKG